MANTIKETRIIDTTKRTLLKYVISSDGTNESNSKLVDVSTLAYSLNTSGYIMSANTDPKSLYRTSIKRVFGAGKTAGSITLKWEGTSNAEIVAVGSSFDFNFEASGDSAIIPLATDATSGDILISTAGLSGGDVYTLFIDLKKDNRDYDAGQSADPAAFNKGTWGLK